jgi:hypothetical protein
MRPSSGARAAFLAAAMNLIPAAPLDILRFLRVPAIVLTIRRNRARMCFDKRHRAPRRTAQR